VVGRQKTDIADTLHLRDVAMATTLAFYIRVHIGATWRIRLNRPCAGGNAAFCQITLLELAKKVQLRRIRSRRRAFQQAINQGYTPPLTS